MAQMGKLEGQVEISCSAGKLFAALSEKMEELPDLCSDKILSLKAHQDDRKDHGTTRTWDYVLNDGSSEYIEETVEWIDEDNKMVCYKILDGKFMKDNYKGMTNTLQVISKGENSCFASWTMKYEKLQETAPAPQNQLEFLLKFCKDLGTQLSNA